MNEELKEMKIKEYQERYRFWTDKRISQLSFHNNLMLTISIGLIAYLWSERSKVYANLRIDFTGDIDWSVIIFLLGILSLSLSVSSGFILSLARLYDLRITSNILLTRKRSTKKGIELKEERLSKSSFSESIRSLFCVLFCYHNYEITIDQISGGDDLQNKFTKLKQMSRNLGNSTWGLLNWQTTCLFVGVVLYLTVLIIK